MTGKERTWMGLVLVAGMALAAMAGIFLYWRFQEARFRNRIGRPVSLLRFERDMAQGERIDLDRDLSMANVSRNLADGLGDVVVIGTADEMKMYRGETLNRNVAKGQFLTVSMLVRAAKPPPWDSMRSPTNVAVEIRLSTPSGLLRPGDRVNLIARVPGKDGRVRPVRVIEDVRVLAVGGRAHDGAEIEEDANSPSPWVWGRITIELTPQDSLDLHKVLAYLDQGLSVELLSSKSPRSAVGGRMNPEVLMSLESTSAPARGPFPLP